MDVKTKENIINWWNALQKDKVGRVQLRRCQSLEEAALHQQTFRLKKVLPWLPLEALATIAGIAAYTNSLTSRDLGELFASPKAQDGRATLSEFQFRQLLSARDWSELYCSLRRAITILVGSFEGCFGVIKLVDTIILWNNEFQGEFVKLGKSVKYKLSESYYTYLIKHN